MKHKLIRLISILLIAAMAWQQISWAHPGPISSGYSLRPVALAERAAKPRVPVKAFVFAVLSSMAFAAGPIASNYFMHEANANTWVEYLAVSSSFFFCVYLWVFAISAVWGTLKFSMIKLWKQLSGGQKGYLAIAALSNAVSGWFYFIALKKVDALSSTIIMSSGVFFTFLLSKPVLNEDISWKSKIGKEKWKNFGIIVTGALLASLYSYFSTTGQPAPERVTVWILAAAGLSTLISSVRSVFIKKITEEYEAGLRKKPDIKFTFAYIRFLYTFAFLITILMSGIAILSDYTKQFSINNFFVFSPFMIILSSFYAVGYCFNYAAMTYIQAGSVTLIGKIGSVFTAIYKFIGFLFGLNICPSWIQIPACLLVTFGAVRAAKAEKNNNIKSPMRARPQPAEKNLEIDTAELPAATLMTRPAPLVGSNLALGQV